MTAPPRRRRGAAVAATLLSLPAIAACYWLLRQDGFHGLDAHHLLAQVEAGQTQHLRHVLYLHTLALCHALLRPLGADAFDAMRLLAATFAAVGVVATFWSWRRLQLDRPRALLAAATAACLPGVVHFATTAELNALAFGGGAAAFLALAVAVGPRLEVGGGRLALRLLPVAALTAVVAGLHSIGNLTPLVFALLVLLWPGPGRGRMPGVAALLLGHAAAYAAVAAASGSLAGTAQDHGDFVTGFVKGIDNVPAVLWSEWVYPFAPVSVLFWLGLRGDGFARRLTLGAVVAVLGYLAVSCVILGPLAATAPYLPGRTSAEYGAYALPIVAAVTGLALRALPRRGGALVLAAAALLAATHWLQHRAAAQNPALRAELEAALRAPCKLVVGDYDEAALVVRTDPRADWLCVPRIAFEAAANAVTDPAMLTTWFDLEFAAWTRAGKRVLLSPRALEAMRAEFAAPLPALAEHIPEHYELVRAEDATLYTVRPR